MHPGEGPQANIEAMKQSDTTIIDSHALRVDQLFKEQQQTVVKHTDRLFARLMLWQWLAAVAAALLITPKTWIGTQSQVHLHVLAAIFLGGIVTALPVFLARTRPGEVLTRHTIA